MAAGSQTTCDIQNPYLPPLMFVSLDPYSRKRDESLGCIPGKQKGNIQTCVISVSGERFLTDGQGWLEETGWPDTCPGGRSLPGGPPHSPRPEGRCAGSRGSPPR